MILYVLGVQHSDSQFLKVVLHYSSYEILAVFPVLYNVSLQLVYFIHSSLYLLSHYPYLVPLSCLSSLVTTRLFSISVRLLFWLYSIVCFHFQIPHISGIIHYLPFSVLLIYFTEHNTLQVHPCCCRWQNFILFNVEQYFILFNVEYVYTISSLSMPMLMDTYVSSISWLL